jgi:type II secretion system protein N
VSLIKSRVLKRLTKILLMTVVALAVALFAGVWILNRWLKSPERHAELERELSLALKIPLKFKSLDLSIFGGLRVEGVTVADRGRNFLEVAAFSAKPELWSLVRGKVVFKEIAVDSPKFVLMQRENGDWKLPDLPPDLRAELDAKKKARKSAEPKAPAGGDKAPKAKSSGDVLVGRIRITKGSAEVFDKDGKPYVSALSIGATLNDVREETVEGYVAVGRLVWHGNYAVTEAGATVSYSPKGFIIDKFKASVGTGTLTGGFSSKPDQPGPPFSTKVNVENVDLTVAAANADAAPPNLNGLLTGTLTLKGLGDNRKTFTGNTTFTLQEGTCKEIEWVHQIGQVFRQEDVDFSRFKIHELKGEVQIGMDRYLIHSLSAASPPLGLTAEGTARLDGTKLDLRAHFLVDKTFLARRPNIEPQFGPANAQDMRAVPFNLTGSLGRPKQNLMEKMTGTADRDQQRIKLGLDVLSGLKLEPEEKKSSEPRERGEQ